MKGSTMHYFLNDKWRDMMHELKKQFTLEEIYQMTGLSPSLVSRAVNGERVSVKPFLELCDLMGVDPHSLIIFVGDNSELS